MRTINDLEVILPRGHVDIIRLHALRWRLSPVAVDSFVSVFFDVNRGEITIDDVITAWQRHGLSLWTEDLADFPWVEVQGRVMQVYRDLGIQPTS